MKNFFDDVQIEKYPDFLDKSVSHIRLITEINGETFTGFGSAYSDEIALEKGISELVERICVRKLASEGKTFSSNGFAAYTNEEAARTSSINELIERDMVMCSWLAKRSPQWLDKIQLSPQQNDVVDRFKTKGLSLQFGLLGSTNDINVCVGMVFPDNQHEFGFTISSAANKNSSKCIDSIILTLHRHMTFITKSWPDLAKSWNWLTSGLNESQDHMNYYLSRIEMQNMKWFFESGVPFITQEDIPITTEKINVPIELPWPVYVYRATSSKLQDYFIGYTKDTKLNFERLSEFGVNENNFNPQPHPLP